MSTMTPVHARFDDRIDTLLFGPPPGYGRTIWALITVITVVLLVLHSLRVGFGAEAVVSGVLLILAAATALLPPAAASSSRLAAVWAWTAVAAATLAQLVTAWDAADGQSEGYAPWYVRGATIVYAAVILRRRALAGWAGAFAGFAGMALVSMLAGEDFGQWAVLVLRQTAALLTIQVFAILLDRYWREVAVLREEEHVRLTAVELRESAERQQHAEAERIRGLVTPTLQRIASGDTSAELRCDAMLLEGALRDTLRGRRLAAGAVPAAAHAARARGVEVVLLDDLDEESLRVETAPDEVLNWVALRLSTVEAPRATVRLAVSADRQLTVSFYAENPGDAPEFMSFEVA